jgi:hypothetical protein
MLLYNPLDHDHGALIGGWGGIFRAAVGIVATSPLLVG